MELLEMNVINHLLSKSGEITSKCNAFFQELVNLSYEILSGEDGNQQWGKFKEFLIEYKRKHEAAIEDGTWWKPCSFETVSMILDTLEQLRHRRGVALSSLILYLMTDISDVKWGLTTYPWSCQFENSYYVRSSNDCEIPVFCALSTKSYFMEFLMRFGFVSSLSDESSLIQKATHNLMQNFLLEIRIYHRTSTEQVINLIKNNLYSCNSKEGNKRLLLAMLAILDIAFKLKNYHGLTSYINSLRMYFAATSDPYLTIFEVKSILYECFNISNTLHLFEKYSGAFDKLMPECPAKMEPRSLSHFARCQIRKNLKVSGLALPVAVNKLPLPERLKNFVVGDVLDLSRKDVSVSTQKR